MGIAFVVYLHLNVVLTIVFWRSMARLAGDLRRFAHFCLRIYVNLRAQKITGNAAQGAGSQVHFSMRLFVIIIGNGDEAIGVDGLAWLTIILFGLAAHPCGCPDTSNV